MSVKSHQIPGGAKVLIFTCACGRPGIASEDAHILEAVQSGKVERAGRWYCGWADGRPKCIGQNEITPKETRP